MIFDDHPLPAVVMMMMMLMIGYLAWYRTKAEKGRKGESGGKNVYQAPGTSRLAYIARYDTTQDRRNLEFIRLRAKSNS
jgi:hypothetical protein